MDGNRFASRHGPGVRQFDRARGSVVMLDIPGRIALLDSIKQGVSKFTGKSDS
jgi:hypothetical protein